jgi:hypothetical protein
MTADSWTPASHHELCCMLSDFVFAELEKQCGGDKAIELSLVVAATIIGAYSRAKRGSVNEVAEAVRLLAYTFDQQVRAFEAASS